MTPTLRASLLSLLILLVLPMLTQVSHAPNYGKWHVSNKWIIGSKWQLPGRKQGALDEDGEFFGTDRLDQVIDTIGKVIDAILIPPWGYWIIIGGLALVGLVAALEHSTAPRGVHRKSKTYTPHKKPAPKRRMPKRDKKSGRFRKR